jgi:hypothetical protein
MMVAAVLVVGLALGLPIEQQGEVGSGGPGTGGASAAQTRPSPASSASLVASLEPVFELRLRQPLGQAASVNTAAPAPARPVDAAPVATSELPPYTLVGTVGNSLALLRGADGSVEIRGVNESVGGVEVLAIEPTRVRVRYNGKVMTLDKPKEPPLPGEPSSQQP